MGAVAAAAAAAAAGAAAGPTIGIAAVDANAARLAWNAVAWALATRVGTALACVVFPTTNCTAGYPSHWEAISERACNVDFAKLEIKSPSASPASSAPLATSERKVLRPLLA